MIVECSGCNTIFPVDPNKVPEGGIHARCSVCSEVFFVTVPESEGETVEASPAVAPPIEAPPEMAEEAEAPEVESEIPEAEFEIEATPDEPVTEEVEPVEADVEIEEPPEEDTFVAAEPEAAVDVEVAPEEAEPEPAPVEEPPAGFHEPTFGAMDDVGTAEAPTAAPLFGKRDPMEKAQRLARVLVSDIILYNPDRHHSATESGRVKEEFEEEIQKSWNEYVEQVGEDVANTTTYFNDALNEILAKGEKIF